MEKRRAPKLRFKGFTDDWEQRKVSDVADRYDNLRIPVAANLRKTGNTPYYGANGIQDYVDGFTHDGEFILVAEDGANDLKNYPVNYVNGRIWVNNHAHVLQGKESEADTRFLGYAISRADIESVLVGGGRAKLNADVLMNIDLLVPGMAEQKQIGINFLNLDYLITLHQRKYDMLQKVKKSMLEKMFPKNGSKVPEIRFAGFTDDWEQRKFGDMYARRMERNNGQFDKTRWISVAKMYFQEPEKVTSNNINTRTYVMRKGDIAFEGHPNADYKLGRFVENYIGDGVISELFPIYKHICEYDLNYWKYAIQHENIMYPKLLNCIEISYTSSNKLNEDFFLKESVLVSSLAEQHAIGSFLAKIGHLITLHQRKLEKLKKLKKSMLEEMFV